MEPDYVLLIMNCVKYAHKSEEQKNTWLKHLPNTIAYFHVLGDEALDGEYVFDMENHRLWVKTPDDYISLPKKVIKAYSAIQQEYDFVKYIFKTDDDQILLDIGFFDTLISLVMGETRYDYGGWVVSIKNHFSKYHLIHKELPKNLFMRKTKYCSGRFYFLSKEAIAYLVSQKSKIETEYFEDYAIGYHLDERFKQNMICIPTHHYFRCNE